MSVNIEASTLSMPESLNSLKETPLAMHRIIFEIEDVKTWYRIMQEARHQFKSNWRSQSKVKRKLERLSWSVFPKHDPLKVWFEVPDPGFATWISVKYSVSAKIDNGK